MRGDATVCISSQTARDPSLGCLAGDSGGIVLVSAPTGDSQELSRYTCTYTNLYHDSFKEKVQNLTKL